MIPDELARFLATSRNVAIRHRNQEIIARRLASRRAEHVQKAVAAMPMDLTDAELDRRILAAIREFDEANR